MSEYTPRSVQLLEGSDDFSLPVNLQSKYRTSYNHVLYGAWSSSLLVLDVGTEFSFSGYHFMISKSNIDVANLGLFILSYVLIPPKQSISLMPFCDPIYLQSYYLNIVKYKHIISMYSMYMNGHVFGNFNRKNLLYIDGRHTLMGILHGS